jgi:hypothetical protein
VIEALDDDTFHVSITPVQKKGKNGEMQYNDSSTSYSAASLAEAIQKIEDFAGGETEEKVEDDAPVSTKPVKASKAMIANLTKKG